MTSLPQAKNQVREKRITLGLTQADVAHRAGISRTSVTAIEGEQIVPSVQAALSLAKALQTTVEELFGTQEAPVPEEVWAWAPPRKSLASFRAEILGRTVIYPATSAPSMTLIPDGVLERQNAQQSTSAEKETLVIACCDPAAGLLASYFAAATGLRLVVLQRSSQESVELLGKGLVHLAGTHLSTREEPDQNARLMRTALESSFHMIRLATWQEGVALRPATSCRSVQSAIRAKLNWIGREPGSGARQCLDQLLPRKYKPQLIARNHSGVVEAVRSGWADAGVCVRVVCEEAGLSFLPVREEAFDVGFPSTLAGDRRIKAFLKVVRSQPFRKLLSDLPGYETAETGEIWEERMPC